MFSPVWCVMLLLQMCVVSLQFTAFWNPECTCLAAMDTSAVLWDKMATSQMHLNWVWCRALVKEQRALSLVLKPFRTPLVLPIFTCCPLTFYALPNVSETVISLEMFDKLPRQKRTGQLFQRHCSAVSHNASGSIWYLFTPIMSHAVFRAGSPSSGSLEACGTELSRCSRLLSLTHAVIVYALTNSCCESCAFSLHCINSCVT